MYERLTTQVEPVSANEIPLGTKPPAQSKIVEAGLSILATPSPGPSASTATPTFMMASLSNKNKRKGFKQAMCSTLPKKIIFSTPEIPVVPEVEPTALPFTAAPASEIAAAAPNIFPRLVPPSEKQEGGLLPANMFVTSIDVEEGMNPKRKKNKKKRDEVEPYGCNDTIEVENMVLDYGEADNHVSTQRECNVLPMVAQEEKDWAYVDKHWVTLTKVKDSAQLRPGAIVGWKVHAPHITLCAINLTIHSPGFGD
jgi:hypothetical protein